MPVTEPPDRCPHCQAALGPGADRCPSCGRSLAAPPENGPAADPPTGAAPGELERRLGRLRQWREVADALGVEVPTIPRWVEARARREPSEGWDEVVERVERDAAGRIAVALAEWETRMKARLDRLDTNSVNTELSRGQVEEALDAARKGEVARTLASCRLVERMVTLKEHHLDQAREEIARVVSVLSDMEALGLSPPEDPARITARLDEELRHGWLAPLKQRLRSLRAEATDGISERLPEYVTRYGAFLLQERTNGEVVDREVAELALCARTLFRGQPEEALHRLRQLAASHPAPWGTGAAAAAPRP